MLDASLHNTPDYKVWIKSKWSNPREGVVSPQHLNIVDIEKEEFGPPSTLVTNFIIYIYICMF